MQLYLNFNEEITSKDGLLLKGTGFIIPRSNTKLFLSSFMQATLDSQHAYIELSKQYTGLGYMTRSMSF